MSKERKLYAMSPDSVTPKYISAAISELIEQKKAKKLLVFYADDEGDWSYMHCGYSCGEVLWMLRRMEHHMMSDDPGTPLDEAG